MLLREDIAGDVLASITTLQWNGPAEVPWDLPSLAPGPTIMWRSLCGLAELLARLRAATRPALLPMTAWLMCGAPMLSCGHPQ